MKKVNIVKKNEDFNRIINLRNSYKNEYFIINIEKKEDLIPKFGISVSKKNANAVVRNKKKRQIKDIIDKNKNIYQKNLNYIIIIRKGALDKSYQQKQEALIKIFNKINEENVCEK